MKSMKGGNRLRGQFGGSADASREESGVQKKQAGPDLSAEFAPISSPPPSAEFNVNHIAGDTWTRITPGTRPNSDLLERISSDARRMHDGAWSVCQRTVRQERRDAFDDPEVDLVMSKASTQREAVEKLAGIAAGQKDMAGKGYVKEMLPIGVTHYHALEQQIASVPQAGPRPTSPGMK